MKIVFAKAKTLQGSAGFASVYAACAAEAVNISFVGLCRLSYSFAASSIIPIAMTIHSANAAVFRVTRIAGLSIIQLYFASMILLLNSDLKARALKSAL